MGGWVGGWETAADEGGGVWGVHVAVSRTALLCLCLGLLSSVSFSPAPASWKPCPASLPCPAFLLPAVQLAPARRPRKNRPGTTNPKLVDPLETLKTL